MSFFFFSSRRRHTRWTGDWSSDVCSSDLRLGARARAQQHHRAPSVGCRTGARRLRRRSEERRVGKECSSRWSPDHEKKKNQPLILKVTQDVIEALAFFANEILSRN